MTPARTSHGPAAGTQKRKDRRFKQWNKTRIWPLTDQRRSAGQPGTEAFTYDLSIGGARIHSAEPFDVGSLLRLQIELVRTGETLRVEGIVKWRRREETADVFEMGVEFQHTSMVTVLSLMKDLHDGRRPASEPMGEPVHAGRS
ncbi:MAG TPA: PilZ domain-containing protein [Candidatus Aminicenantes bacterium]|nr:PilZ domain-containing protein [Candidatus Aminicenantes bacterium]HRY66098.1 PilZ domain-containing protein [Candidatus Aminicenantes bacterium]HRZ73012.1 PilZ domain-containing protein [Candidatus Aminicenantes bacterium]